MNNDQQIQEIQLSIEDAKQGVAFGEAIDRLMRNKDFQLVIDEGYTTKEPRRLTMLLGDPTMDEARKKNIVVSLQAIGELHQYLRARLQFAEEMRNAIPEAEAAIAEMEVEAAEAASGDQA